MPPKKKTPRTTSTEAPEEANPFLSLTSAPAVPPSSVSAFADPARVDAAVLALRAALAASVERGGSALHATVTSRVGMEGLRKAPCLEDDPAAQMLGQIAELSAVVAAGERAARAEFACRRHFTLGLQRLATLPESETGYDGSKANQAAALQHLVKGGVAFKQCRNQIIDGGWVAAVTETVLDGAVRIATAFSRYPAGASTDCNGWCKAGPVSAAGPVFSEFGVDWYATAVGDLTGEAVKKLLPAGSPLKALSPKTLDLVCRMASCVLPALPDAFEDSWKYVRGSHPTGFSGPILADVLFSGFDSMTVEPVEIKVKAKPSPKPKPKKKK